MSGLWHEDDEITMASSATVVVPEAVPASQTAFGEYTACDFTPPRSSSSTCEVYTACGHDINLARAQEHMRAGRLGPLT